MERDCNRCIWATRDGGCASWDCEFIAKRDAATAYMASRWIPYRGEVLPDGLYIVSVHGRYFDYVAISGCFNGEFDECAAENVSAYMLTPAPYSEEVSA